MTCQLLPLHQQLHLMKECCDLLNREWKKSDGFRLRNLQQSNDNLPCSLVMVLNGKVVGHVRISGIVGEPKSLFLTSVIIAPDLRGKGFGRKLLQLTENYVLKKGFQSLCLTSDGKEKFYKKCGFIESEPVQQSSNNLLEEKFLSLQSLARKEAIEDKKEEKISENEINCLEKIPVSASFNHVIPPPPAPPIPQLNNNTVVEKKSNTKTWMRKSMQD